MSSSNLIMQFSGSSQPELLMVTFSSSITGKTCNSVRGKTPGAFRNAGTFQWTSAVHGLSILMLRSKLHAHGATVSPVIHGPRNSLASSLDYAVSKGPFWLSEMFGFTANGDPVAKRLFQRSNPNLKRPGPVAVAINQAILPDNAITVQIEGQVVTEQSVLFEILAALEEIDGAELPLGTPELRLVSNG